MNKFTVIYTILITMLLIGFEASAYERNHDCEKHPIYCQIINNRPTIKKAYAFKLSNVISKKTRSYKLDPKIFTAILAQESMYKISARNCTTGLVKEERFFITKVERITNTHTYIKKKVCTDFGIGQIWYKTADSYDFNIEKLTSDVEYSVEAAAIVLEDFKNRYSHKEEDWWTRYNANSRDARNKYKGLVERFISAD